MGFNEKMSEGLEAVGKFSFEEVSGAVNTVVRAMGEKAAQVAKVSQKDGLIGLYFYNTGALKLRYFLSSGVDMIACVEFKQGKDGTATVSVSIEDAKTTQQRLLYFIPISPKTVHGLMTYRDFISHLRSEIKAIDNSARITIR